MTTPTSTTAADRDKFVKALLNNVLAERRNAEIYDYLAVLERDGSATGREIVIERARAYQRAWLLRLSWAGP